MGKDTVFLYAISFRLIARQVYPEGIDNAITNTTKEPEGKRSKCNSGGKSNTPELPDFSGHPGDRRIASLLRL